jgi:adenylylsulfate kinase
MKILIMGLPGAGKTTLASALREVLWADGKTVAWFNADAVRAQHNDWDFTPEGRARQNDRMLNLANEFRSVCKYVICDFVAPLNELREMFNADFIVWVDTINTSRFEDTNLLFEQPENYDIRVTEKDSKKWATTIASIINPKEKL